MATGAQGGCRTLASRIRLPPGVGNTLTESRCGRGGQISAACKAARCGDAAAKRVSAESGDVEVDRDSFPLSRLQAQGGGCPKKTPRIRCGTFLVRTSESQVGGGRAAALGFAGTLARRSSHDEWPLSISDSARSDRGARPRLRLLGRQLCAVGGRSG